MERKKGNHLKDVEPKQDLRDQDRFGRVPDDMYGQYLEKHARQAKLDECLRQLDLIRSVIEEVKVGVKNAEELLQQQQTMLQDLAKGIEPVHGSNSTPVVDSLQEVPESISSG